MEEDGEESALLLWGLVGERVARGTGQVEEVHCLVEGLRGRRAELVDGLLESFLLGSPFLAVLLVPGATRGPVPIPLPGPRIISLQVFRGFYDMRWLAFLYVWKAGKIVSRVSGSSLPAGSSANWTLSSSLLKAGGNNNFCLTANSSLGKGIYLGSCSQPATLTQWKVD